MKCIRCEKDCRLPERRNGKCPHCKGVFAFEPQKGDPITDWAFAKAIREVSGQGYLQFYPEHLYYQVLDLHRKKYDVRIWWFRMIVGFFTTGFIISLFFQAYTFIFLCAFLAVTYGVIGHASDFWPRLDEESFDKLWQTWINVHGYPPGLLTSKSQSSTPQPFGKELLLYSFDRAVICDNPQTVDVLLANRFHFEHNCAILGIEGYPSDAFETVKAMLKNNPKLQIFVLHDCTIKGCMMAQQLATDPDWFKGHGQVIDVGLRPGQTKRFKRLWSPVASASPLQSNIFSQSETKWLTKYQLELAVVPPKKLMKLLYNAFTAYQDTSGSGSDVIYMGSDTEGGHNGGEIDGFG